MINLNVQYLSNAYIASVADSFLRENGITSIPVNIEYIIESNYRMDIIPIPSLQTAYDIEGCSAYDFTAIFVDQHVYERIYNRYRFTLAHELGHKILHQEYYNKLNFSRISDWAEIVEQMDESDRSKMEYQAYMFAGMILVPKEILRVEFNKQLQLIQSHIDQAQLNGISREDYLPIMTDVIANGLSPKFEVSRSVLIKRIKFESFEHEIR